MQDLLGLPDALSLDSFTCKVSTGAFEPYVSSDEAYFVKHTCENPSRVNIITCKDEYLHEFIAEAKGLKLDTKLNTTITNLPYYIPVFDSKLDIIPNLSENYPVVALTLKDIVSGGMIYKAGCFHEEKSVNVRSLMLNSYCFNGKKVILFSSGPDTLIESVWYKRDECNFYNKISKMDFYAATGFNFSLFTGECPMAQHLNMKRSLISSFLYEQSGTRTIPHIYALTKNQVDKWCIWLRLNPNLQYFTVNCQMQNSEREVNMVIQSIKAIFSRVPTVDVILHGFPMNHLYKFGNDILKIHLAESGPHKAARNYRRLICDTETGKIIRKQDDQVSLAELIAFNFDQKRTYLEHLRRKVGGVGMSSITQSNS
ncbi:MAG: hypothetical protein EOO43_00975 [Flavobacterium sp.]|nr:MAG: hypothetical protein EOO43_00975 [Flavobacterium sp.]